MRVIDVKMEYEAGLYIVIEVYHTTEVTVETFVTEEGHYIDRDAQRLVTRERRAIVATSRDRAERVTKALRLSNGLLGATDEQEPAAG